MKRKLFVGLALVALVAGAAAIPQQATESMPEHVGEIGVDDRVQAESSDTESDRSEESMRQGPPGFVQDKVPSHVLDKVPGFFWN